MLAHRRANEKKEIRKWIAILLLAITTLLYLSGSANAATEFSNYIKAQGGSFTVSLTNTDNTPITQSGGVYQVITGQAYNFVARATSPKIDPGSYEYQLPSGLTTQSKSGDIIASGTKIGTWTVNTTGKFTLAFDTNASNYSNYTFSMDSTLRFTSSGQTIKLWDNITVKTESPDSSFSIQKVGSLGYFAGSGNFVSVSQTSQNKELTDTKVDTVQWAIRVKGGATPVTATSGKQLQDILADSGLEYFPTSIVKPVLSYYQNGSMKSTSLTASRVSTTTLNLTIPTVGSDWYMTADSSASNHGYVIYLYATIDRSKLPNEQNKQISYKNTATLNGTSSTGSLTTIVNPERDYIVKERFSPDGSHMGGLLSDFVAQFAYFLPKGSNGYTTSGMNATQKKQLDYINSFPENQNISYLLYDITVDVPATTGDGLLPRYQIADRAVVRLNTNAQSAYEDEQIKLKEEDILACMMEKSGRYDLVPNIKDLDKYCSLFGSEPEYAYSYQQISDEKSDNTLRPTINILSKCKCNSSNCDLKNGKCPYESKGYCSCWDTRSETRFHFITGIRYLAVQNIIAEHFNNVLSTIQNYAYFFQVTGNSDNPTKKQLDYAVNNQGLNTFASKTRTQEPTTTNKYTATYKIDINTSRKAYIFDESKSDNYYRITDKLSDTQSYEAGSMKIVDNTTGKTMEYGNDYTVENHAEEHQFVIIIKNAKNDRYAITYNTVFSPTVGSEDIEYTNSCEIEVEGVIMTAKAEKMLLTNFNASAEQFIVSLHKTDASDQSKALAGASYGLYSENGELIQELTTDNSGDITWITDTSKGVIFYKDKAYYIQETMAPEGYTLDENKHWFYFQGSTTAYDSSKYPSIVKVYGGSKSNTGTKQSDSLEVVQVQDEKEIRLINRSIKKVWDDEEDKDGIRPDSVTVLLKGSDKKTYATVTLDESNGWKATVEDLSDEITYSWEETETSPFVKLGDSQKGYETSYAVDKDDDSLTILTNTHIPKILRNISVYKKVCLSDITESKIYPSFIFTLSRKDSDGGVAEEVTKKVSFDADTISNLSAEEDGYVKVGVTFQELEEGEYTVTESGMEGRYHLSEIVDIKNGSLSADQDAVVFSVTEEEDYSATFINEMEKGSIKILKYASNHKTLLDGVEFDLICSDGTRRHEITKDGTIQVEDLLPGEYSLVETKTKEGLSLLAEPIEITIPLVMSKEEAEEKKTDVTKAKYDEVTGTYYFYDLTYNVSNGVAMDLPHTGGQESWRYLLGGTGCMLIVACLCFWIKKRKTTV